MRRRPRPERPRTSGVAMGPLFELFHPSTKHIEEQRQSERMLRVDEESGDPPLGIDLDAGTAVLRLPRRSERPGHETAPDDIPPDVA